jgi:DNA polymerase V
MNSNGIAYSQCALTLDQIIASDRHSIFFGRVSGDSMNELGIFDGDLLVVDRGVEPKDQDVIVANLNGEFVCKILDIKNRMLLSANPRYKPVYINECDVFSFEGVVTSSVRVFRPKCGIQSKLC